MTISNMNIRKVEMTRDQLFDLLALLESEDMPNNGAVDLNNALEAAQDDKGEQYILVKITG